ncbi:MAG: CHAT domain-containing protein, partial [bacterium]
GEGVYGLRRALVLAGAESQLMSLWQVSDAATRDLMVAYYKRIQAGEGRSEALRQVQLEMLRDTQRSEVGKDRALGLGKRTAASQTRSHPFYWASFIPIGDWRSLQGKE